MPLQYKYIHCKICIEKIYFVNVWIPVNMHYVKRWIATVNLRETKIIYITNVVQKTKINVNDWNWSSKKDVYFQLEQMADAVIFIFIFFRPSPYYVHCTHTRKQSIRWRNQSPKSLVIKSVRDDDRYNIWRYF